MLVYIYTDGSYSDKNPNETWGAMIALSRGTGGTRVLRAQRYKTEVPAIVSARNVGGELVAAGFALATIAQDVIGDGDGSNVELCIVHDYVGISKFVQPKPDGWSANKTASILYVNLVNAVKKKYPKLKVTFKWVKGHSGDYWNTRVDELAAGIVSSECQPVQLPTFVYK